MLKVCKPISVSVPPLGVNLEGSINAVVGTDIVLTCTSASSNPAASLKWYRNSDILPNNQSSIIGLVQTSPGADNGQVTSQTLTVTPTSSMDGDNYICTAHVQGIAETVESNSRTLNLKCKYNTQWFWILKNRCSSEAYLTWGQTQPNYLSMIHLITCNSVVVFSLSILPLI